MVQKQVSNVKNQKPTWKTLVLAELLVKEMRKIVVKTGEWGPNARSGLIKNKRKKTLTHGIKVG
jgi:hypothetical protein